MLIIFLFNIEGTEVQKFSNFPKTHRSSKPGEPEFKGCYILYQISCSELLYYDALL